MDDRLASKEVEWRHHIVAMSAELESMRDARKHQEKMVLAIVRLARYV